LTEQTTESAGTEEGAVTLIPAAEVDRDESTGVTVSSLLVSFGAAIFVCLVGLASYHTWFAYKPVSFAKVNLAEIIEIRQLQFSMSVAATDLANKAAAREEAVEKIALIGTEIESAVAGLSDSCGCTLLVTGAVVSSDLPDYTPLLKERMGLGSINLESLRQQASTALSPPISGFSLPQ
jgi:hypothetical protein